MAVKGKVIVIVFLMAGIISTFAYKLQSSQLVTEGDHEKKRFFHPYFQSMSMFIGEALCLIVYFSLGEKAKLPLEKGKSPHQKWFFAIPATSDAISSMLQYMGLAYISGSTYMMFKGTSIVTTAIFSKFLVGMKIQKRHIAGCGLAILGLIIVGASGFFGKSSGGDSTFTQQLAGYVLMLCSLIFNGFLYAYEQRLLKKHTIHPLEMVGFEGMFGIILLTCVITILSFIPCPFGIDGCVFNDHNKPFMELPSVFFRELGGSAILLLLFISGILAISIFNFGGVTITKMFDALTRSLLNVTKTAAIWIIGIVITLCATTEEYKLESLTPAVIILKVFGFIAIILGTLIYNKLILVKYFPDSVKNESLLTQQDIEAEQQDDIHEGFEREVKK